MKSLAKPSVTRLFATALTVRCAVWPSTAGNRFPPTIDIAQNCLVRKVKVKRRTGELEEVQQYYHHYVVALLLGPALDVVLGIEPVLNEEARRDSDPEHVGHEGELTHARGAIDSFYD